VNRLKLPVAVALASLSVTIALWRALRAGMAHLPSLILGVGVLLSAGLACMAYFAGQSRRREEQLREAAQQLRDRIAEREVAENALRASEERYRSLVDSASDIIYRADPDGHFTFVNAVATRLMKRTQDELVGLHFLELVDPAWRQDVARFYAEQVHSRTPQTYFEFPALDGENRMLWIGQNVQLLQERDTVVGFQAVARDITEQRMAGAEIANARDRALESDRLKSEFVANVSHELRTPMNGILGLTDLLLETELTPEQREHALTVRECGVNLLALLNDILDLSKVAAGKLEIQAVAFEPRRLLRVVTELFEEKARSKGVELGCVVHHEVPESVVGDPGRVRQVLTNLLANAVKFTETGEITVRLTSEPKPDGAFALKIEVTDTGIGVSPEAQAQLFQPFVQADGSITRKYGGTGLGLVISRQLAELMGGELGMASTLGSGSTFWFSVRVMPGTMPERRAETFEGGLRGLRVVALDDSEISRHRLRALLESWDIAVTDESSASAAVRTLKAAADAGRPYDVVLVDLRSAGMTELDFAATIHESGVSARTRVILISGRGHRGDALRARELGVAAYLSKPIGASDLFDCLVTVTRQGAEEGQGGEGPALVTRYSLSGRGSRPKGSLLVVEDNIINQKVLVGMLNKLGYRADVANNGIEALDALERATYPLVLMDSQMPQLDGFATTAEIRRREADTGRRTVIVAVTAHAMSGERERCLAAGLDDYMSKPVSLERLKEILERWLTTDAAHRLTASDGTPAAESTAAAEPPLDPSVLDRLRDLEVDEPGFLADLVSLFLRETPERLDAIGAAIEPANPPRLASVAHALKGSTAAIGARQMSALAARVEDAANRNAIPEFPGHVAALRDAFETLRPILQRDYLTTTTP
jgi:two-component system, sensor histidine kinase and response regulator